MRDIINAYDQLRLAVQAGLIQKSQAVYVHYISKHSVLSASWRVSSPYFLTNPDAAWFDNGCMSFTDFHYKKDGREQALAWASEKYGVTEWAKNRMGDFVPEIVNKNFPLREDNK